LGSCNRLLIENPQNALFHILRSCAWALSRVFVEADVEREVADGLRLFRRLEGWDMANEQQLLGWLLDYIGNADDMRLSPFATALVNSHARWLNTFTDGVEKGGFAHV